MTAYVPKLSLSKAAEAAQVDALVRQMAGRRFAVLTGAGCSTESGIPDYRGPETRRRARSPIRFAAFIGDPHARRRYWARALLGWPRFADKRPNAAHLALAELEHAGHIVGVITQNVDDLHERAGSRRVVALHGSLSQVCCLDCQRMSPRAALHERLLAHNPGFSQLTAELAPDGDAELPDALLAGFVVVDCERCGGPLKPWVVFFGENVPPERVHAARSLCDEGDGLLVVGSSLEVYSGLRFVKRAAEQHKPVVILNVGTTRGDRLASLCIAGVAGRVLPALQHALCNP